MAMKKRCIYIVALLLCFGGSMTSCSCSPESIAKRDAMEMNRAIDKCDADAMDKAERRSEKHLDKYRNDMDKYFRYVDTYKKYLY